MFEIPADLTALTDEELATALAAAIEAFTELADKPDEELSDEDVEQMEALGAFVTASRDAQAEREAAVTARTERLAAARAAVAPVEEDADDEAAAAAAAETEAEAAAAALTASGRKPVVRRASKVVTPPADPPARPLALLAAAADVPGFATGAGLESLGDVARAVTARMGAFPKSKVGNFSQRYGVATLTKQRDDELVQTRFENDEELINAASKESRLSGGSLIAAGGWCAPSQTIYDLFGNESTDGIIDLPEVNVTRGGIKFTKGPQFSDIYEDTGFAQTEAEAIAATEKTFYDVECPNFTDVRLDAVGLAIRAGILTSVGYPELIQRYIEGALIAHQHKVAARLITAMNTAAGAATSVTNAFPNTPALLTALELVGEGERQRYRLAYNETLEVVLPRWVRPALRADLANRNGVDMLSVTDAQIDAHFGARGLRVQWVYNYQGFTLTSAPVINYPANVEALIYPAGTFVKGSTDVITLDAVYDSTGLKTNTYTALFAEEGVLLANTRYAAKRITLPLSVSGLTASNNINQDWGSAGPLNTVPEITVTGA